MSETKKRKILSTAAQKIVIQNKDLIALVSQYLKWSEVVNFILVCRTWNNAFLSRPWGTPYFVVLVDDISYRYIKYVKQASADTNNPIQLDIARRLKLRKLHLFVVDEVDHNLDMLHNSSFTSLSIASQIDIFGVIPNINKILATCSSRLKKLNTVLYRGHIGLPYLPKLTVLSVHLRNCMFNDVYWPINPDTNFTSTMIDLRHLSTQCPNLKTFDLAYVHDLTADMNAIYANVGLLYMELAKHHIEEIIICEYNRIMGGALSPLFAWLKELTLSRTLHTIHLNLNCNFTSVDYYKFSDQLKGWKGKIIIGDVDGNKRSSKV